ncbi:D-sedoheptulose 7-phosphate isomerase [Bradyrhizobium barranii subsp. apii]|uniref:Phosphoheptose isomerase n=1 Tax=Bradyrhizobium barranii subsp. apii TaxID=2819348 RepID=A0A8U0FM23_9BRAD|nr:D-sedoheptulose 7-phosphate isomerase [Bradyrhizobium barranii]UPT88642.1 D-sedoheptulose 7-phosphate isomerase [Bradyrhizobium barranii subsp. apii]
MAGVSDIRATIAETARLLADMAADEKLCVTAAQVAAAAVAALRAGRKVMICGNGGSAADAQHWAGELVSRFNYDRPALAAIALTTDASIITACGNDYGYDYVFARQVEALGVAGDVLFALSTSGNSRNVVAALEVARNQGITTVAFTGRSGGKAAALCDFAIRIPHESTPRIQEGHEVLGHSICALIEAAIFPNDSTSSASA